MEDILSVFKNLGSIMLYLIADMLVLFFLLKNRRLLRGKFYSPILFTALILGVMGGAIHCFIVYSTTNRLIDNLQDAYAILIFFSASGILFLAGIYSLIVEEKIPSKYRESVWVLFLKGFFTLGLYIPFWHLKRSIQFTRSGYSKFVLIAVCYFFFLFIALKLQGDNVFYSDWYAGIFIVRGIQILLIASVWASLLSIRDGIIEEGVDVDILATLFLGPLYLQYKINQLQEIGESESENPDGLQTT